ncbi:MAG: Radical SAM superfamily enzyme [Candidatus Methanohalarchaeum thermophilum]|uniref:Radical SAM superfamily enzyme n=1 Tax=Methanohalarchaeum thermophilum TaxID=1903181 RepID=A0A1Q6DTA1_METT1|nr:MAG: Radical SAM superfamily enzyme [Candidatus Methanohalarchaeum thermophilum]
MKNLDHYYDILKNEKNPNYLETKNKKVEADLEADLDTLWKYHENKEPGSTSLLDLKARIAEKVIENCQLCENRCGVNRGEKQKGLCDTTAVSRFSSDFLHRGEEPELVPSYTIFFTGCTFDCVYCQNWEISQKKRKGDPVHPEKMAKKIVRKKLEGAKNVNFVGGDPLPNLPIILKTLSKFEAEIPIIWNSNMYMTKQSMKLLNGVVDLYLADFRYGNDECAKKLSSIDNYFETLKSNLKESKKQADILLRHLVLPNHLECCTQPIAEWCAQELGKDVRFNLMFQYRPEYKAKSYPEIDRRLTNQEKDRATKIIEEEGLENLV